MVKADVKAYMKLPVAAKRANKANDIDIIRPYRMVSTNLISVIIKHQSRPAVCNVLFIPLDDFSLKVYNNF